MGGSSSKSEFSRKKSLIRRSSQRSLFQSARRHLIAVNRKIEKLQSVDQDKEYNELRLRLDEVQKELDSVSDILKDKHKEKYEDSQRFLRETFEKLEAKVRENAAKKNPPVQNQQSSPRVQLESEDREPVKQEVPVTPKLKPRVELSLLKVLPTPENSEAAENPIRTPRTPENSEDEGAQSPKLHTEENRASKASRFSKLGIQVLPPVLPQTRLTMLLENKRNKSQGSPSSGSPPISPKSDLEKREKYRPAAPDVVNTPSVGSQPSSPSFFRKSETKTSTTSPVPKRISGKHSPVDGKAVSPLLIKKDAVQNGLTELGIAKEKLTKSECYKIIEESKEYTEHLERQLKLFKGNREDPVYFYLQEGFFRNLMKLDNIEPGEDAVLRQEKKLSVKRIEELVKLLDMKVTASLNNAEPVESSDDDVFDEYAPASPKESISSNGKPAVTTHL